MAVGDLVLFNDVFASEKNCINERRRKNGRPDIELEPEASAGTPLTMSNGTTPLRPADESNVVGLSLPDGGIRSAAFCIGALQALDKADIPAVGRLSVGHIQRLPYRLLAIGRCGAHHRRHSGRRRTAQGQLRWHRDLQLRPFRGHRLSCLAPAFSGDRLEPRSFLGARQK